MSVRFSDTWAMPYSSMNQPMAFTALSVPGSQRGLPSASRTTSPVSGSPRRCRRPRSRTSKAMALARRVEVVFRLTLYATRKSRAPTAVAPERGLKAAGPKSGAQAGSARRASRPSYSPARTAARSRRSG